MGLIQNLKSVASFYTFSLKNTMLKHQRFFTSPTVKKAALWGGLILGGAVALGGILYTSGALSHVVSYASGGAASVPHLGAIAQSAVLGGGIAGLGLGGWTLLASDYAARSGDGFELSTEDEKPSKPFFPSKSLKSNAPGYVPTPISGPVYNGF